MVKFPDSKIREIRNTVNIVEVIGDYVSLKKAGPSNYKGLCPFHPEKTPSFTVNAEKNVYHCFGCGVGGDVFSFLTEYHHVPFVQAVRDLAKKYHIPLPSYQKSPLHDEDDKTERIYQLNEIAADYYANVLEHSKEAQDARDYLAQRGFSAELSSSFRLGYALPGWQAVCQYLTEKRISLWLAEQAGLVVRKTSGGFYDRFRSRLMFPILDTSGRVHAFGGRVLDESLPKYLNSPETAVYHKGDSLYGLHLSRGAFRKSGYGIIVEGYFDFLSLFAHGIENVVATLGTALTANHLRKLKGYAKEFVIVFDSDQAGIGAALRSIPLFLKEEMAARILVLPASDDPDTFIRAHGREEFENLVNEATPMSTFLLAKLVQKWGNSLEGKINLINEIRTLVSEIKDPVKRSLYLAEIAKYLDIPLASVEAGFEFKSVPEFRAVLEGSNSSEGTSYLERTILEILLLYPEYVPVFLNERGDGFFESEDLNCVFTHFGKITKKEGFVDTAWLLMAIEDAVLKSKLTAIMLNAPAYEKSEVDLMVRDILSAIRKKKLDFKRKILRKRIEEAERNKQHGTVMELLEKKKELLGHTKN